LQPDTLDAWCCLWLDGETGRILFNTGHLSNVVGLQLADRRAVVVKVRPTAKRLVACALVQCHLWAHGYACLELLAGPGRLMHRPRWRKPLSRVGSNSRGHDALWHVVAALADLIACALAVAIVSNEVLSQQALSENAEFDGQYRTLPTRVGGLAGNVSESPGFG
jgi:hypothetical protein